MDQNFDIKQLYSKFLDDTATPEEVEMLLAYMEKSSAEDINLLIRSALSAEGDPEYEQDIAHLYPAIQARIAPVKKIVPSYKKWLPYAAAATLLITVGLYWFTSAVDSASEAKLVEVKETIPAGGNKARITFSNGQQLELDSTQTGLLTVDGKYVYADGEVINADETIFATVSTPIGGTYQITLPDGTKAWLNASSSLTYPREFNTASREVTLEGEGYFEVSKDAKKPFIVNADRQKVQVLGTRFNVNAYSDESVAKTTLVEGSVQVSTTNSPNIILQPNEQAVSTSNGSRVVAVDASEYIGWTKGEIVLTNLHLPEVLRQLERWYDVTFAYTAKGLSDKTVFGVLDRTLPLDDILASLEKSYNINFKREGRRVHIEVD